jgi:capsular exopolysaccharide synthesis family protein
MTRLSEALKRAAETAATPAATTEAAAPAGMWQFAPAETMYVPEETSPEAPPAARPLSATPPPLAHTPAFHAVPDIRVGDADRDKLVVGGHADGAVVEQFRHLAAVLHHAQEATGVRSVMVTSAMPSEGKTLTATNLALTLSESYQRRVLLIDGDLRRPRLREMFALPETQGLTDSLTTAAGDRLPVHQVTPTLWVLTAGRMLPDPMSLLSSPAMKQLIDDARDSFDWVVVDTPPIAILPDANLLSSMIDTALLVVSAQSTPYPMVQRAADAIGPKRILGVVLNRAEHATLPSSGYYRYNYSQPGHPMPAARKRWFGWLRKSGGVPHVQ